jgi:hypothetical protein
VEQDQVEEDEAKGLATQIILNQYNDFIKNKK